MLFSATEFVVICHSSKEELRQILLGSVFYLFPPPPEVLREKVSLPLPASRSYCIPYFMPLLSSKPVFLDTFLDIDSWASIVHM